MDPDVALAQLIHALEAGDLDDAEDNFENLTQWIENGGFPPKLHRAAGKTIRPSSNPGGQHIAVYYSRTTPESVEAGDFSETGEYTSIDIEPDPEYEETVVDATIEELESKVIEASSSEFHPGIWYQGEWAVVSYETGEEEANTYHLKGYTQEQEREIYDALKDGGSI